VDDTATEGNQVVIILEGNERTSNTLILLAQQVDHLALHVVFKSVTGEHEHDLDQLVIFIR